MTSQIYPTSHPVMPTHERELDQKTGLQMSYLRTQLRRTGRIALLTSTFSLALAMGVAGPAMAGSSNDPLKSPQTLSNADLNSGGANGQCTGGSYCSTRDGSPSLNGNGNVP